MRNENCFGHYVFEDVDCMLCSKCSECQYEQKKRNDEYKLSLMPEECRKCDNAFRCKIHIPKSCLGKRGKRDDCDKCSCGCKSYCIRLSTEPIKFKCTKNVKCFEHNRYFLNMFGHKFEKGKEYEFYISCDEVYYEDYKSMVLLFRDKNYIFNNYFEESK